jgi:hypothetical protein
MSKIVWPQWERFLEKYGKKQITATSVHRELYGTDKPCTISKKTGVCNIVGHYSRDELSSVFNETEHFNSYLEAMDFCGNRFKKSIQTQIKSIDTKISKITAEEVRETRMATFFFHSGNDKGYRFRKISREKKVFALNMQKNALLPVLKRTNDGLCVFKEKNPRPTKRRKTVKAAKK